MSQKTKGLSGAFRRVAVSFLLAGTAIAATTFRPARDAMQEQARQDSTVNQALIDSARRHYMTELMPLAETAETRWLDSFSRRVALYKQLNATGVDTTAAIFIDPDRMDVPLALELDLPAALTDYVARFGGRHIDTPYRQDDFFHTIASLIYDAADYKHDFLPTTSAGVNGIHGWPQLVVPESRYFPAQPIHGIDDAQRRTFVNLHEAWHTLLTRHVHNDYNDFKDKHADLPEIDDNSFYMATQGSFWAIGDNIAALTLLTDMHWNEISCDVAACGEMIRQGEDPSVIDAIIGWRTGRNDDAIHMSALVLTALKDKIGNMGVDRFRALGDAAARKIYAGCVREEGMTVRDFKSLAAHWMNEGPPTPRAARFHALIENAPEAPARTRPSVMDETEKKRQDGVLRALLDAAHAQARRITPQSVTAAYFREQERLRAAAAPADDIMRLRCVYLNGLMKINYADENRRRGTPLATIPDNSPKATR